MLSLPNTFVQSTVLHHRIEETCGALNIKIMAKKDDENLHNFLYNQNCMISISIKNSKSQEKLVCSNIPVFTLMQFTQYRKGYWTLLYDKYKDHSTDYMPAPFNTGEYDYEKIGIMGLVALSPDGNIILERGDFIEVKLTKLPNDCWVSISTVDMKGNSSKYLRYSSYSVLKGKTEERFNVDPSHTTILLPISQTVDNEFTDPEGRSYDNPLDNIRFIFTDRRISDMRLDRNDVRVQNILNSGNDVVGFWASARFYDEATAKSMPQVPAFIAGALSVTGSDNMYANSGIFSGCFDYGLLDLEDVDYFEIYKSNKGAFPFFIEKEENM